MTMWGIIGIRVVAAAALALAVFAGGHVHAQTRGTLVVTVSDTPDPAPTLGQVTYSIAVLNNGTTRAYNVIVTVPVPPGTQFVKCSTSNKKVCAESAGTVSTNLGAVKAHATVKVSLILKMPLVNVKSTITLTAKANGDGVDDGSGSQTTTILAGTAPVVFLPSNRTGTVSCGDTLGPATFGADTTMQFKDGLGCASAAVGLTVSAPGKTVNLNKFKIVTDAVTLTLGSVGIRAVNASNATIAGGSTGGSAGLEYFDFGVKDDGGNGGLLVSQLRVFRARSAGVRTVSDGVTLSSLLVDKATATANTTAELPGGVGIHASGITKIQNSIIRRSGTIGIWADGTIPDASGYVVTVDGNTTTMQVQQNAGLGIQLDGGPHNLKNTLVSGDGIAGLSTDAVVVGATSTGSNLDGLSIKLHGGNGVVVNGNGARISRSTVDTTVGLDAFVIVGGGSVINGNDAQSLGNGFVISGPDNVLTSNNAEGGGDGYVVTGDRASLSSNTASQNDGRGFVIQGASGVYNTNTAESTGGDGFLVTGASNTFGSNQSKQNLGMGFNVSGTGNHFRNNAAELNASSEWVLAPGNLDDGGNKVSGSTFTFTAAGGTFN